MTNDLHTLKPSSNRQTVTKNTFPAIMAAAGVLMMIFTAFSGCIIDLDENERDTEKFVYYSASPVNTLDPAVAYDDISIGIINNLYERLVTYKSQSGSEISPMLAKNTGLQNGNEYIFYLKDGIKFSSGNPVDADAVNYSISRVLTMRQKPSWMLSEILNQSGIHQDDYDHDGVEDIKFILEQQYSAFEHILAFSLCSIVDPEVVEAHGGVQSGGTNIWMSENSAGSGPYKVKKWQDDGEKILLKRNSKYHKGWGGKHFEEIKFRYVEDELKRLKSVKKDEDGSDRTDIPISLLSNLTETTSVTVDDSRDTMGVVFLGFNTETAPFDSVEVRKAFAYTFDYNVMLNTILKKKYGERLHGPIPEGVAGYEPNLDNRFYQDFEIALEHFRNAGYTVVDGMVTDFENITLNLPSNSSVSGQIINLLKNNLAEIGINIDISFMNMVDYNEAIQNGELPVFLSGWSADFADPDDFVYPLLHSESEINLAEYDNETIDEMIEDGKTTLSPADRNVIYEDIQNEVNEEVPYIWLYQPKHIAVMKSDVAGYNYHPILGTNYYEMKIIE